MGFSLFTPNQPSTWTWVSILLLLLVLCEPSHGFSRYGRGISESGATQHPNNCGDLVVQSQCSHNSKCIWCTSELLDDMCFTKSEAWRLPLQVYSCALIR